MTYLGALRSVAIVPVIAASVCSTDTASAQQAPRRIAFVGVSVLPMTGDRAVPRQTVLVSDGVITAVGPAASTRVPAGAARVDGTGKFLLPGLVDLHVHLVG